MENINNLNRYIVDFIIYYYFKNNRYQNKTIPLKEIFKNGKEIPFLFEEYNENIISIINKTEYYNYIENNYLTISQIESITSSDVIIQFLKDNKSIISIISKNDIIYNSLNIPEYDHPNFETLNNFKEIFYEYLNLLDESNNFYSVGFQMCLFQKKLKHINRLRNKKSHFNKLKSNKIDIYFNNIYSFNKYNETDKFNLIQSEYNRIINKLNKTLRKNKILLFGNVKYSNLNDLFLSYDILEKETWEYFHEKNIIKSAKKVSDIKLCYSNLQLQIIEIIRNIKEANKNPEIDCLKTEFSNFIKSNQSLIKHLESYFDIDEINIIINSLNKGKFHELGIEFIDLSDKNISKPKLFKFLYFFEIISFHEKRLNKLNLTSLKGYKDISDLYNLNWSDSITNELQKHYQAINYNNKSTYPFKNMKNFNNSLIALGFKSQLNK